MNKQEGFHASKWMLLIYLEFSFYYIGIVITTYLVSFRQMQKISKNFYDIMLEFNKKLLSRSTLLFHLEKVFVSVPYRNKYQNIVRTIPNSKINYQ